MEADIPLEAMLCDPEFFGLTTAAPVMRAACRIADGLPLGDLVDCDDARIAVGGTEALRVLAAGSFRPSEFDLYAPPRTGKSLFSAVCAMKLSRCVDASMLRIGEVIRIGVQSLDLDKARAISQHFAGAFARSKALRSLLLEEPTADTVLVRHPSGRTVEIKLLAGARMGGQYTSRWFGGVVFDEKPRMLGSLDGAVVNYDDAADAVENRILPGGQNIGIGSLWAPMGPAHRDVTEHLGKPTPHKVVLKCSATMLNPYWWTPKRCQDTLARNPRTYPMDVLGEFGEAETAALPGELVSAACARDVPPYCTAGPWVIVGDLSAMMHDAIVLSVWRWLIPPAGHPHLWVDGRAADGSIVREAYPARDPDTGELIPDPNYGKAQPLLQCGHIEGWEPSLGHRVTSGTVADRVVSLARQCGCTSACFDQFDRFSFEGLLRDRDAGLRYHVVTWTGGPTGTKAAGIARLRSLLVSGQVILPNHPKLREELIRYRRRLTQTGDTFEAAPGLGGHGDYASCAISAAVADQAGLIPCSPLARSGRVLAWDPYSGDESAA